MQNIIPAFALYGEHDQFPDVIHIEDFSVRAPIHNWRILPHRHSQMSQLFMVKTGRIEARTDEENHVIGMGDFLYIPEHCVHEFVFKPGSQGKIFSYPVSVVRTVSPSTDQVASALSRPFAGSVDAPLKQMTQMLDDIAGGSGPFRAQQIMGMAHSVLAHLADISISDVAPDQMPKHSRLFALDELIAQNLSTGWSASDFAKALSLSTGHLSRMCRTATGHGAATYIEQRRMQEACRLLAFTQLPVSEIGYRLGFIDPSHFSKRFRAARGQTPTNYRALFTA